MNPARPTCISYPALLRRTGAVALVATLAAMYPAWAWSGPRGVVTALAVAAAVGAVMLASGLLVVWAARGGSARAATVFVSLAHARALMCLALGGVIWLVVRPGAALLLLLLGVFYASMLLAEAAWLARALSAGGAGGVLD